MAVPEAATAVSNLSNMTPVPATSLSPLYGLLKRMNSAFIDYLMSRGKSALARRHPWICQQDFPPHARWHATRGCA
jgi:hypothetical protein